VGLGCSGEEQSVPPDDLISELEYIRLIAEFEVINAYLNTTNDLKESKKKTDYVLKAYGISMDQFERSNAYYEKDIDSQIKRLDKALDIIDKAETNQFK